MRFVVLRGEDPPDEAVVVVCGGAMGLDVEAVARSATRNLKAIGFLGVSVYLALDQPVAALCATLDELRRYGQVRLSTVGRLRGAGFALLATGDRPHFDIVLPDLGEGTLARLDAVFDPPQANPGRAR